MPLCWHIFFVIFEFPALIHGVYTEWITLSWIALSGCKDSVLYGKNVTISVGLASVIPDKKSHMHDFLDQADQALYESKAEGRHCLRVYDSFEN